MKLTASITIETPTGDKMIPTSKELPGEIDGNTLRNIVHQTLCSVINDTMAFTDSRVRAVSLVVEA
jgi:hypothetical protein